MTLLKRSITVQTQTNGANNMTAKSDELVNELVSAAIAFGREREPDWQTRIEDARVKLCEYIEGLEAKEEVQE